MSQFPKKLANGYTAEELDRESQEKINRVLPGPWMDVVRLQPDGWIVHHTYIHIADKLSNFKFRPDDVIVMTYPKCGTTWVQEIIWNMRHNPDLDNPDADDLLFARSPQFEGDQFHDSSWFTAKTINYNLVRNIVKYLFKHRIFPDFRNGFLLQVMEANTTPRLIKTHLPFSLLPKNVLDVCKVVYVYRNPLDNLLSAFHFYKLMKNLSFTGTLDDFVDCYVNDTLLNSPYGQHLRDALSRRHHPNLFLTSYEQLTKDIRGEMKRLDAFLGTKLTEKQFNNVLEKTSFQTMKECDDFKKIPQFVNEDVGQREGLFFRQGKCGTWKDKLTPEQKAKLDAWIKTNFTDHGITFEYE